ncbi:MAG: AMP-binding protein, partial [Acidimicrobiales bacterium]
MTEGPATIPALLAATAAAHPDTVAVVDGDTRLTYAELRGEAHRAAAALVAAGLAVGDSVGIWAFNCAEWIVAALGSWSAGCVVVPVNTRFKGNEAADVLRRGRCRALVTVTDFLGTDYVALLRESAVALDDLATVVVARGPVPAGAMAWSAFLAGAGDDDRAEADRREGSVGPDDPSDILFTSGTTGAPKGVVQTHARTLRVGTDWVAMTGLDGGDRYLMVNPYFHMFGLKAGILASMAAGARMLPQATFDVDTVLRRIEDERVTVLPGAPTLYQSILDHPGRAGRDLTSLRVAVT